MRMGIICFTFFLFFLSIATPSMAQPAARSSLWVMPSAQNNGQCFRELFMHPAQWIKTRAMTDVLGYADHNIDKQFSDAELKSWLPMLKKWNIKLSLEVGAVKEWSPNGANTFLIEKKMWDRVFRLGGSIYAIAMDEPLCCSRQTLHKPDSFAVQETANFIAHVRRNYPDMLVGDIEPYPYIPLADQEQWIDALQARLKEMSVRGLDFYRLDVDWAVFDAAGRGSWMEVKKLEDWCHTSKLPFSLIYWSADYPAMQNKKIADDSTWYVGIMQQAYNYVLVGGKPDQYVIESWLNAPSKCLPEDGSFTFMRSVHDFAEKFVR
jgi:hypothetical protein